MSFESPLLLWLLLLAPAIGGAASLLWRRRLRSTEAWASPALWPRLLPGFDRRRLALLVVLSALTVAGTAVALAGPLLGHVQEEVERRGIDLVFVIDSSLSMSAIDVSPDRLTVAKTVIRRLLRDLPGHRIALVQTEGEGDVLAPLTMDRAVVDMLLTSVEIASLPTPGTRLSDGLARALDLLPQPLDDSGVVVVVSDGEDHSEDWDALLERVREAGVAVHTMGIGTKAGSPLPIPGTSPPRYKTDREGRQVHSRLQPDRLETLASATNGVYLQIDRPGADLSPLVDRINDAQQRSFGVSTVRHARPRFQWFLAIAVLALSFQLGLSPFRADEERS